MKRTIKILAMLLTVIMIFTGCMTVEENYKINATNNKVSLSGKMEINKQKCLNVIKKSDETIKSDVDADKQFRKGLQESYKESGYACSISTTTKDDIEYYVVSVRQIQTIEAFNNENATAGTGYMSTESFYEKIDAMSSNDDMDIYGAMGISQEDMNDIKVTTTVEFPNKIVSQLNGKIDETNPNKITFEYNSMDSRVLFATTNSGITVADIKKEIKNNYEIITYKRVKKPSLKSVKVISVKKNKGTVRIKINKVENATYEVQYSTNKKFKKAKTKKSKKTTINIKKLNVGKKYYFRVRAIAKESDRYIYLNNVSKYSNKKSVIIKKK